VSLPSSVLLDDGSALAVLLGRRVPAAQEALAAGRVILSDPRDLWPDGTVRMQLITDVTQPDGEDGQSVRTMRLPAVVLAPTVALDGPVVPPSAARSAGVDLEQQGFLASTTAMPSTEQQQKAAADLEDLGAYLQVERGYTSEYGPGLIALVVAALLVTLVGTFTAVGLAATEGRADVATLAAVGASPGLRRRLAAGQAGVIAGLGSALGLASGALTGWALVRLQQPSTVATADGGTTVQGDPAWAFTVPWAQLGLIGLGIPLLTVAVAFTLTRSKLPITRRLTG
jgi:putative ABC transport system permease protein